MGGHARGDHRGEHLDDLEAAVRARGWTAPFVDDEGLEAKAEELSVPFDLLLGRRTYEIFAGCWPNDAESAIGKALNDATGSRSLRRAVLGQLP